MGQMSNKQFMIYKLYSVHCTLSMNQRQDDILPISHLRSFVCRFVCNTVSVEACTDVGSADISVECNQRGNCCGCEPFESDTGRSGLAGGIFTLCGVSCTIYSVYCAMNTVLCALYFILYHRGPAPLENYLHGDISS